MARELPSREQLAACERWFTGLPDDCLRVVVAHHHFASAPDLVQCGTSTSRRGRVREREKNSFNFIQVDPELVRVTRYLYFSDLEGFAPASEHFFPRASRPHLPRDAVSRSLAGLKQAAGAREEA